MASDQVKQADHLREELTKGDAVACGVEAGSASPVLYATSGVR